MRIYIIIVVSITCLLSSLFIKAYCFNNTDNNKLGYSDTKIVEILSAIKNSDIKYLQFLCSSKNTDVEEQYCNLSLGGLGKREIPTIISIFHKVVESPGLLDVLDKSYFSLSESRFFKDLYPSGPSLEYINLIYRYADAGYKEAIEAMYDISKNSDGAYLEYIYEKLILLLRKDSLLSLNIDNLFSHNYVLEAIYELDKEAFYDIEKPILKYCKIYTSDGCNRILENLARVE